MKKNNIKTDVQAMDKAPIEYIIEMYMYQIQNLHAQIMEKELRPFGISEAQFTMLNLIHFLGDKATPSGICKPLMRQRQSINLILDRMEKADLVKITSESGRRGSKKVILTKKAQEIITNYPRRGFLIKMLSCLSPDQRKELLSYLKSIRDNMIINSSLMDLTLK